MSGNSTINLQIVVQNSPSHKTQSFFSSLLFLLLLNILSIKIYAQDSITLKLGDAVPALRISQWLKGKPVQEFEKGKIYVVEFWSTWCHFCRPAMPRFSKLARKYKRKAVFIGIDVYEDQLAPAYRKNAAQVKNFVDSMGRRMTYNVARSDSDFMETAWLKASGETGIPSAFVVNTEGTIAWMGHPMHLDKVLPKILENDWNVNDEQSKRDSDRHLAALDDSLIYSFRRYDGDPKIYGDFGQPDSMLLAIEQILKEEPNLKYAPIMAFNSFSALLKKDQHKAYEYGKEVLMNPTYEPPAAHELINCIDYWSDKITLFSEIYELGAEAYQTEIDNIPYPEVSNMPKLYNKMAAWYWRGHNKSKAIDAEKKAIKAMKKQKNV